MNFARNLAAGAAAGGIGTAAMDLLLYRRYRRDDGKESFGYWESAAGVNNWDDASAPGQVGHKALRTLTGEEPPDEWARSTTNLVHWATGIGWGIQYGILATRASRHPWVRALAFGPAVWLSGYVVLGFLKVYKPIWRYDLATLGDDLSAHMTYGSTAAAAFAALRPISKAEP